MSVFIYKNEVKYHKNCKRIKSKKKEKVEMKRKKIAGEEKVK